MPRIAPLLLILLLACSATEGGVPTVPPPPPAVPPPPPPPPAVPTHDLDALGVPRFVTSHYIALGPIARISKFRSGIGHEYRDDVEQCRSMKHYFQPRSDVDWATVPIHAPVSGTIAQVRVEWAGVQLVIQSGARPAFTFILFHVNPTIPLTVGSSVVAGQQVGWHVGSQTMSDIAVEVATPTGRRLVSWFEVITDAVFADYALRGVPSRGTMIITRAERDADPLGCTGEAFQGTGTIENWLLLD